MHSQVYYSLFTTTWRDLRQIYIGSIYQYTRKNEYQEDNTFFLIKIILCFRRFTVIQFFVMLRIGNYITVSDVCSSDVTK